LRCTCRQRTSALALALGVQRTQDLRGLLVIGSAVVLEMQQAREGRPPLPTPGDELRLRLEPGDMFDAQLSDGYHRRWRGGQRAARRRRSDVSCPARLSRRGPLLLLRAQVSARAVTP